MAVKKSTKAAKKINKPGAVPKVAIIMGSQSDWATMKAAADMLKTFNIPHEVKIVSAHRTPQRLYDYATSAAGRGLKIIIAGAGGAAHLPGMTASLTSLPVLGVPVKSKSMDGLDALLSIAQMPKGIPVATLAVGEHGAANAGLFAAMILGLEDAAIAKRVASWRTAQSNAVAMEPV